MISRGRMPPDLRHRIMASIQKKDTVPELKLRSALWAAGIRGWRCHAKLPGTPDIVFSRWKVAVFVDGVWWHGHPRFLPHGKRGPYWDQKIAKNMVRDTEVNRALTEMGWHVLRIWDLDVLGDSNAARRCVVEVLLRVGWRPTRGTITTESPGVVLAPDRIHIPAST